MNRKEFFRSCAGTLCSCSAATSLVGLQTAAAQTPPAEDWRLPFIRKRYAKLIEILSAKVSDAELSDILRQLGSYCASGSPLTRKFHGDLDGFIREFKKVANEDITYDREKGIITVVGPERPECFCPLIDTKTTSKKVCGCSLGWQQQTYETLLDRKVRVELKESVLCGGKRCVFEVRLL